MSGPPEDRMTELRQLFFETAGELVQRLNDEAMQLEKSPGDEETARSLRRTVHTLKGDSAACGFRELSELAHEFEDVLTAGNKAMEAQVPAIALRAADGFAGLLEAYQQGTKLPSIRSLREEIASLAHPNSAGAAKKKKTSKAALKKTRWSEYEQLALARAAAEGKKLYHVTVQIDPQCAMPIAGRQMIQLALAALGEVLAIHPPEGSHEAATQIEAAIASEKSAEHITIKCSIPTIALGVKVKALRIDKVSQVAPAAPPALGSLNDDAGSASPGREGFAISPSLASDVSGHETLQTEEPASASPVHVTDKLLRVDAERIDSVLNLVGELILAKSMLQQALVEFGERFPKEVLRGYKKAILAPFNEQPLTLAIQKEFSLYPIR